MYARFLFGWTLTPEYHPLSVIPREYEPELIGALRRLVELSAETEDGTFTPQDVSLTPEAVRKFEEFRQFADREPKGTKGNRHREQG